MSKIDTEEVKSVFLLIVAFCAMIGYAVFAACIIMLLAIVVPWAALTLLEPVFQNCPDFLKLITFLFGLGVYMVLVCFVALLLLFGIKNFHRWLVVHCFDEK